LIGERRQPDVSVVVVAWNSADWIGRCIASVAAGCGALERELIVHDNASRDGTPELARAALGGDRGEVIASPSNDGFAGGVNRAVARARGRYVMLLNPDCELEAGSVETLVARLESRPEAAGAAPLLVGDDGTPQREFQLRRFPTLRSFASELLMFERLLGNDPAIDRHRCRDLDITREQAVEQPAGAALLVRRELFASVGPLDERFAPAWFEDVDFCRRVAEAGLELLLVPAARVVHHGGASLEAMAPGEFVAIWYRNLWRYAEKWLTADERELLRLCMIAGGAMRVAAVAAGLGPETGRRGMLAAYAGVVRSAWSRWQNESRSY
jgi:GT2 family glycosyltransferase